MYEFDKLFSTLVNKEYFTYEELVLVTNIKGNTVETLNDCIYARYGYRDLEQMEE